ncbi:MAG: hypothetical protein ABSB35_31705 [Bryobacteraceae bacterium]|jgi:hypothetical protein
MRIDQTHRGWFIATVILFGIATLAYIAYAISSPKGPTGGSAVGLAYGIAGYAMMLFAGLLGARKKVPVWRIGRAQTWMRGHLWLGLLSFPFILYHSGFAWRGQLTAVLMILFFVVVVSGIIGAAIQHYVPRVILTDIPLETIYEEIPHVREQLRAEADQLVSSICGSLPGQEQAGAVESEESAAMNTTTIVEVETEQRAHLRRVYLDRIRPFLILPEGNMNEFGNPNRAAAVFESLHRLLPAEVHPVIEDLESICEEERQLIRQQRLYRFLHTWLLVHVPLSIALLVLAGIHAIVALQY